MRGEYFKIVMLIQIATDTFSFQTFYNLDSPDKEYIITRTGYSSFLASGERNLSAGTIITILAIFVALFTNRFRSLN